MRGESSFLDTTSLSGVGEESKASAEGSNIWLLGSDRNNNDN